jgi:ubiquitin-like protein Pup
MARFVTHSKTLSKADSQARIWMAADSQQKQKPKDSGGDAADAKGEGGNQKIAKKGEELKEEMDSLMDEIDSVLEENAEEFVKNYVQRGGQ